MCQWGRMTAIGSIGWKAVGIKPQTHVSCQLPTFTAYGLARAKSAVDYGVERLEQRLCVFEIGRAEAFGEPTVDRGEKIVSFGVATLVAA